MNISVKDMIISFAAGLVIFSLLMVFVCVGIFNSEIEVAASDIPHSVENEKIDLHSVVIFTVPSLDSTNLDFAVLAMLDETPFPMCRESIANWGTQYFRSL